jgi:hypothetical protein
MSQELKDEIKSIISGKSKVRYGSTIQAASNYLTRSLSSSRISQKHKHFKREEEKSLRSYITDNNLWLKNIDFNLYVSEGAEQRVYLFNESFVLKLNDSIYYESWQDYFTNLLLHNFFFYDTAYELLGFYEFHDVIYAVVKQPYIKVSRETNLMQVKHFMLSNNFQVIRNNDYQNADLGVIIEDLHDENVLTQNGILYFIDTVFYLTESFWKTEN